VWAKIGDYLVGVNLHTYAVQWYSFWYGKQKGWANCRLQRSGELLTPAENTSDFPIWPVYVGVQSIGGRIETEAELGTESVHAVLANKYKVKCVSPPARVEAWNVVRPSVCNSVWACPNLSLEDHVLLLKSFPFSSSPAFTTTTPPCKLCPRCVSIRLSSNLLIYNHATIRSCYQEREYYRALLHFIRDSFQVEIIQYWYMIFGCWALRVSSFLVLRSRFENFRNFSSAIRWIPTTCDRAMRGRSNIISCLTY